RRRARGGATPERRRRPHRTHLAPPAGVAEGVGRGGSLARGDLRQRVARPGPGQERLGRSAARLAWASDGLRAELKGAPMDFFIPYTLDELRMIADKPKRGPKLPLPRRPSRRPSRRTS